MPGTFHYENNASSVTLPPIQAILGPPSPYDPIRATESIKDPPPPTNGYHDSQSLYSSPPHQPNGSSHSSISYPSATQAPVAGGSIPPSQALPYLNAPYAPPRDHYPPTPHHPNPPEPSSTYPIPSLSHSHPLKATALSNAFSPAHLRGSLDHIDTPDSRGPTRPVSNEHLRSEPIPARQPVPAARNVVDVREIPGEGECYVLEDGTFLRTVIAGERVNPAWGITKAGKPRKRLAKACATCREKKIKCEQGGPGDTKCVQCARLNRPCKM